MGWETINVGGAGGSHKVREREIVDCRPLQWLCSLSGPVDSGGPGWL